MKFFDDLINSLRNLAGTPAGENSGDRKVRFSSSGRSGHVLYESPEGQLRMYYEFGGGDVVAIIDVPSEAKWAAATAIPPEKRLEVLHFVGKSVVQQQTRNGSYEIQDNCILIR